MRKKYIIKSPDGFTIEPQPYYQSHKQATKAFIGWLTRYKKQGYYSTIRNGERVQIPVADLSHYCEQIIK